MAEPGGSGGGGRLAQQTSLSLQYALFSMMGGQGMTAAQMTEMSRTMAMPPIPDDLKAALKKEMPKLGDLRRQLAMTPQLQAELKAFQHAMAALDPADPDYAKKLAQIPKPALPEGGLKLPELDPDLRQRVKAWSTSPAVVAYVAEMKQRLKSNTKQRASAAPAARPAPPPAQQQPQQQQQRPPVVAAPAASASPGGVSGEGKDAGEPASPPAGFKARSKPAEVEVVCNGLRGIFLVDKQMMVCFCSQCAARADREGLRRIIVSPSEFERHAGTGHSKKWKYTIRTAVTNQTIGAWLADQRLDGPSGRGRFARSLQATMQRKSEAEAEELAASRAAASPQLDDVPAASSGGGTPGWQDGPWAEAMDASDGGSGGGGGALSPALERERPSASPEDQPALKKRRTLRWIRKATESPSGEEGGHQEGGGEEAQQEAPGGTLPPPQREGGAAAARVKQEGQEEEEADAPLLPVMLRAAQAAEAAWERQQVGPAAGPPLLPPLAIRRKPGASRLGDGGEPPGLRSPTGKPWLQADHAMHEEHDGTDMRLGEEYQAALPPYRGPPPVLGPLGEAQEPLAPLPGPSEAEALASAAGPEREHAAAQPRDATADVWLREVADQVRATVTGRQQRQRKQSRWLQQTFDPNAVLGGKALVERQFDVDDAPDRFMVGRRGAAAGPGVIKATQEIEAAATAGARPEVGHWALGRCPDGSLGMEVKLSIGGHTFTGLLRAAAPAPTPRAPRPALAAAAAAAAADGDVHVAAAIGRPGLQPAASGVSSEHRADTPAATGGVSGAAAALAGPQEGDSRPGVAAAAVDADVRRAAAEERMRALEAAGAPPGAKCALCRGTHTDAIPDEERGEKGCSLRGMGPLILVRVSAVSHAWVHDQCARWSPEVHDPEGNNQLEGLRDAVRRGRMLRCKTCGEKGATLGCFKRTCRASYHLACARNYRCLLQVEPYLVACPEHVNDLPPPYNAWRQNMRARGTGGVGQSNGASGQPWAQQPAEEVKATAGGGAPASAAAQEGARREGSGALARQGSSAADGGQQALLAQLAALNSRIEQQRKLRERQEPAAAAASVPPSLPFPLPPGALASGGSGAWVRERIVEAPLLRAELEAEQGQGAPVVVVNVEGQHFRFRSFSRAEDMTAAVQADADAILVLSPKLLGAAASWRRAHVFPLLPLARQLDAFVELLLRDLWGRLTPQERRANRQLQEMVAALPQAQPPQAPPLPASPQAARLITTGLSGAPASSPAQPNQRP